MSIWGLVATVSVSALAGAVVQPPPPTPPPGEAPITIAAGGTYSGNWASTSSTPAVRISTSEPVTITNSTVTNMTGGPLIETDWPLAANVTLRRVKAFGGNGKFLEAEGFESIRIENCTIDKTSGIKLVHGVAGSSVLITRNKHRNIQRGSGHFGNFVQFAEVQNATIEVSWNEIINEFGKSEVEDVVSLFKTAHARVHDNYIQGGYPLSNTSNSSANGITVELGDDLGPYSFDNHVYDNQVIDNAGGVGLVGGYDNTAYRNRVVQDGKLPSGEVFQAANLGFAIWRIGGFSRWGNNHAYDNVVGYVHREGFRNDYWFPDAPADYALNRSMRGKITRATEQAEWTRWQQKIAANRISVGA